jgi:hypothetical protein
MTAAVQMTRDELTSLYRAMKNYQAKGDRYRHGIEITAQIVADLQGEPVWIGHRGLFTWVYTADQVQDLREINGVEVELEPEPFMPQRRKHTKEEKKFYRLTLN